MGENLCTPLCGKVNVTAQLDLDNSAYSERAPLHSRYLEAEFQQVLETFQELPNVATQTVAHKIFASIDKADQNANLRDAETVDPHWIHLRNTPS